MVVPDFILELAQSSPPTSKLWQAGVLVGVLAITLVMLIGLAILTLLRRSTQRRLREERQRQQRAKPPTSAWQEAGKRAEPWDHDPDVDPLDETR